MKNLSADIAEMFADLDGYAGMDAAFREYRSWQAQRRIDRGKSYLDRLRAWIATLSPEQLREIRRRNWLKRKADPVRYEAKKRQNAARMIGQYRALSTEERKARNRKQFADIKANPARLEKRRKYNREQARIRRASLRSNP